MEPLDNYILQCSRHTLQNRKEGFFKDLVDKLLPLINIHQFSNCKSDLERISFCTTNCWDLIGAELIYKGKNAEDSIAKRLEGNTAFENKQLQKALLLYSQSLIRAPTGPELPLVYSNRSALLQKMNEWQLAISDAELALSSSYPENNCHKLYERIATCQLNLKNYSKAKISANLAKHFASIHDRGNTKFQQSLENIFKKCESPGPDLSAQSNCAENSSKSEKNNMKQKEEDSNSNTTFSNASSKVGVNVTEGEGRFAFAKETIFTGEQILKEAPYAACLLPERMGTHCLYCFVKLKAPIPCETCSNVAFCSTVCRSSGEKYHQFECRVFTLLLGSGMSILPMLALRIVTQGTASQFLKEFPDLTSQPDKILLGQKGEYETGEYKNIYNLSALEEHRQPQDFLERTIMALFLVKCLRLVGYFQVNLFKNPLPTIEELQIGSLILRNLQVLQFNAYEICEFIMESTENFRKSKSVNLGLGVYPTASFLNHSCAPNVTRYFDGTSITVESIATIPQNAPIADNYGPVFTKIQKKDRQFKLQGRYWFTCSCAACIEEWGLIAEAPIEISPSNSKEERALERLEQLGKTYFEKGLELMDQGKGVTAAQYFKQYIDQAGTISNSLPSLRNYKTIHLAQEALKLCVSAKGTVHVHSLRS